MDSTNHSVLIVDDERFVLDTTAFILRRLGCVNVFTAESAYDALDHLDNANPPIKLILTDLNMPDVDGVELLRLVSERGYTGDIVLFSGEDPRTLVLAETLAKARKLSVLGSIAKPLKPDELAILLDRRGTIMRMPARPAPDLVTAEKLDAAIKNRQLEPWFQPKICIASKRVVGVEALVRWPDKTAGMIYPDAFIPVAEAHGLIDPLTFLVIQKSAAVSADWRSMGLNLQVAVNVSMNSLHDIGFPDRIADYLNEDTGFASGSLKLEVTESQLMQDLIAPLEVLLRMRLKKIKLSIDDFGTGHSNIGQLRDLPFDELKLDRSYVHGSSTDPHAGTILESTVSMAKKLGMEIVAEGVETEEDLKRVALLGCDQAQGYFISRPLPAEDIPSWVAKWNMRHKTAIS